MNIRNVGVGWRREGRQVMCFSFANNFSNLAAAPSWNYVIQEATEIPQDNTRIKYIH